MFLSRRERQHIRRAFEPKPQSPDQTNIILLNDARIEREWRDRVTANIERRKARNYENK